MSALNSPRLITSHGMNAPNCSMLLSVFQCHSTSYGDPTRREQVHLKHSHWVRAQWSLPHTVYPQLRKFSSDPFPQLPGELELDLVRMRVINVDVEAAPNAVGDR